jgi:hypothetical protein
MKQGVLVSSYYSYLSYGYNTGITQVTIQILDK